MIQLIIFYYIFFYTDLNVGPGGSHIGIVVYSTDVTYDVKLNVLGSVTSAKDEINDVSGNKLSTRKRKFNHITNFTCTLQ